MNIESIGTVFQTQQNENNNIDQQEFIELFLAQLTYQDPLEPVDNSEFLAQMAQFSALEQARQTSQNIENLLFTTASSQASSLLGQRVDLGNIDGVIKAVTFSEQGPRFRLETSAGEFVNDIPLSQIRQIISQE
ncbi:flagellar hook assembly protein FlgD [Kangiella sp. HZ709]|uniref:flagellar hook assembly protein FlgD n=1 Tax=Kangiella sp. HZ709 TaxID=2666328 RepID=UPI0012AEE858|nr:flagellar hook capping FlgD N-terminal domain-containing protein [Kangiella sp. HZ709]MRX26845.1 flagellar hook capping protein [Kangiella sp. HZ709]